MRAQLQGNGLDLLLDSQAYRVLKRINQFSRPTELFASCCWLFTEQRHIHARLTAVGEDTHKRAAASVLKTTLDQLVRPHVSVAALNHVCILVEQSSDMVLYIHVLPSELDDIASWASGCVQMDLHNHNESQFLLLVIVGCLCRAAFVRSSVQDTWTC